MRFDRILGAVTPKSACIAVAASSGLAATDGIAEQGTIEEVVVTAKTGSRIGRQGDSPSPLSNYDGSALREAGLRDLRDLVGIVAINAGAENNADNLTQNFTVGTANINLRGLGVASTLVLLNGRRQVLSAVQTDDGSSFVDLAVLVPALAIERMEVLKDGATAINGSEAVAGVANFITRHGFERIELQAEYRSRTGNGSQDDITLDGVVGGKIAGDGEFLLAASYLDRTSLVLIEVDWLQPATSGFGNPGSFNVPSLGRTIADAGSELYDGLLQELTNGGTICRFDYGPQITAVPNEQRAQAWGRVELPWSDTATVWAEFGYARNNVSRDVSPQAGLQRPIVPCHRHCIVELRGRPADTGRSDPERRRLRPAPGLSAAQLRSGDAQSPWPNGRGRRELAAVVLALRYPARRGTRRTSLRPVPGVRACCYDRRFRVPPTSRWGPWPR